METIIGQTASGAAPAAVITDSTDATFVKDVIEGSRDVPIIVDFWATWCGPCKQLGPILEKEVRAANGAVKLVKVDIDHNPMIAQQLRIQSIPTVYAFFGGRPVDGFQGALPESQVKAFIDRLIKAAGGTGAGPSPIDEALAQANDLLESGDHGRAAALFGQIMSHEPDNLAARAGLARSHLAAGKLADARKALDGLDAAQAADKAIAAALAALDLAEKAAKAGSTAGLEAQLAADPANHQARYDLALAQYAAGDREAAIDSLLDIMRRSRSWNDEAARKQLLQFFEAMGPSDPLTAQGRRKLSSLLFS
jgi:putative thioredoxin